MKFFDFTSRERRGILYLIPIVVIIAMLAVLVSRRAAAELPERMAQDSVRIFAFDPNTIDLRGLMTLGFTKKEAVGILNFRERGKRFSTPYDFADCYQVSVDMFEHLRDSIVIAPEFRAKPFERHTYTDREQYDRPAERKITMRSFDPNTAAEADFISMGFTERQARAIVNYRASIGTFTTKEQVAKCYIFSDIADIDNYIVLAPPAPKPPKGKVDINTADSATLCTVRGIGSVTAPRIVAYRKMLGGYVRVEQLAEIKGITEANYEMILKEISIESSEIQKIDINFALPESIGRHPYVGASTLRKLLKNRQLKGGWVSIEDMVNDKILTRDEASRLAPYLIFSPFK